MRAEKSAERLEFERQTLALMQPLYRGALHLTRDAEAARELVQETYLRAYRAHDQFEPGTNCQAWAFTIMYSVFNSKYRSLRRERVGLSLYAQEAASTSASPADDPLEGPVTPQAAAQRMDWAEAEVDRALQDLPADFRVVVLLVDVGELSYDEAAKLLDCPVGTVRSRLFRARRLLHAALLGYAQQRGWITAPVRS